MLSRAMEVRECVYQTKEYDVERKSPIICTSPKKGSLKWACSLQQNAIENG